MGCLCCRCGFRLGGLRLLPGGFSDRLFRSRCRPVQLHIPVTAYLGVGEMDDVAELALVFREESIGIDAPDDFLVAGIDPLARVFKTDLE